PWIVLNLLIGDLVVDLEVDLFVDRQTDAQTATDNIKIERALIGRVASAAIDVEAGADPAAEEIGLGEGDVERALVILKAGADREAEILAAAEEVALGHGQFGDEALRGRIAAGDRELAGGVLLDIDVEDHAVG